MRKLWREFKAFAMSGSMLDLALGFIIGAAFAKLVDSLASNVMMQLVAAIFRKQDFTDLVLTVNKADIKYGTFLTDLINFFMLAGVLFAIVKFISFLGVDRIRRFGERYCPYCHETIAPTALVCKFCRNQLVETLPTLTEAEQRLAEQQRAGRPGLRLPRRRNGSGGDGDTDATRTDATGAGGAGSGSEGGAAAGTAAAGRSGAGSAGASSAE
jgi:large conductance mechanosensitive channel